MVRRFTAALAVCLLLGIASGQPAQRIPSIDPNHYRPSNHPCTDDNGIPQRCVPDFINVAFNLKVNVSNTCGVRGPSTYCVQGGQLGHVGVKKVCDICDARTPEGAHPPEYLTDFNNPDRETWWQSDTMNEGVQYPNNVTLTIAFGKAYDITYVRLKFISPRPESFAIYKKTSVDSDWEPWQYYSGSCKSTYGLPEKSPILPGNEAVAQCTREFSDISPLTGGNIAFSTLDGRPSAEIFEESEILQSWVTAVGIRIVLNRLNTFGDEVFRDSRVLKSYYYAISDLAVGGRCKCNGHASQCVKSTGQGEQVLVCDCKHHTTGADCQMCDPMHQDRPWRAATSEEANECLPCNCSGLSNRCYFDEKLYEETGHGGHCIDCAGNTQGPHCDECIANHYRRPGDNYCIPCGCNEKGSTSQQCDADGQCSCKPGVTGQYCDQCQAGFYEFSTAGCKDCHCDSAGSWNNTPSCSPDNGACACKPNVEGNRCDKCKPGYFQLSSSNQFGCTPCFCYGHSSVCSPAEGFYAANLTSIFIDGTEGWTAGSERRLVDVQHAVIDNAVAVSQGEELPVYFSTPSQFLGDKRHIYNQDLSFTLRVTQDRGYPSKKDIVLVGASGRELSLPLIAQGNPYPATTEQNYRFKIHADPQYSWNPSIREVDFIGVLANLTAIKIRGTYNYNDVGYLSNFTLGTAVDESTSDQPVAADWVESCECPEGLIGQFCESCAPGYRRAIKFGGPLTKCIKCDCHEHSDSCDAESGACICQHNTAGDTCESCARGYYGNALNGSPNDCTKCDCPENGPCVLLADNTTFCTDCPTGYSGKKCEQCADEFFGEPEAGKPCERCNCNNNTDPNSIGNCDSITGECKKCIFDTTGFNCDKCVPGFWGDALAEEKHNCQPCRCYPPGTKRKHIDIDLLECRQSDGQCDCQANVIGQHCDQCATGFYNLTSGSGCQDCECDPLGSVNATCDVITGQCTCKPGVTGRKCNECAPRHFGFDIEGCAHCDCDQIGAETPDCDVRTGQCLCRDNVEGRRCDQCSENRFNMRAGCLPCDDCYTLIQTRKNEINKTIGVLRENLDEIQNHPVSIDDPEFEGKITAAQELVDGLKTTASEKLNKEDGKALIREVKTLRDGLAEAHDSIKDIDKVLADFDGNATITEREMERFDADRSLLRKELAGAIDYVEKDGATVLEKARKASDKYGDKSNQMAEIAKEAKKLADELSKQEYDILRATEKAINSSNNAAIEANDAIYGASKTSHEIAALKKLAEETLKLLNQTQQIADEQLAIAEKTYDNAARAVSSVQDVKLPNVIPDVLKNESEHLKKNTEEAYNNAQEVMDSNKDNLESARNAIAEAKNVLQQADNAAKEVADKLNEVRVASNRAKDAFDNATATWNEAQETYETLNNFKDNVDNKKDEAIKALEDLESIQKDIRTAQNITNEATNSVGDAKDIAYEALAVAEAALKDAEEKAAAAAKLEEELATLIALAKERTKEFGPATEALENLAETTQNFANQAVSDKDKANEALKTATRAEANANNLQKKLNEAERKLIESSRQLHSLSDVDEDELERLEKLLVEAEKQYAEAALDQKLKKKKDNKTTQDRDNLRRDYNWLNDELKSLRSIYESLPEKCFNQVSLEQEGQKR